MPCYSPLKGWKCPYSGGILFKDSGGLQKMEVSCGQCIGCRLDHSRMWAMRIIHESCMWNDRGGNCFITLTYSDENVPDDWSLHKNHFVKFMKRLRKVFAPQKIRYFHCGEYGNVCKHRIDLERVGCPLCNVGRPHYHAALFNCSFCDLESYATQDGIVRYTSPMLERIWKNGFVDVGDLNFESAAYIARYALKKVTGARAHDHYMDYDMDGVIKWLAPEYITMSRGHRCEECRKKGGRQPNCLMCTGGIGYDWFQKYKKDIFPSDEVPVPGSGVFKGVPRYYEEIFKCEDPLSLEDIKAVRQVFMEEHAHEYTPERLMTKYKVKKAQAALLKRSM